MGVESHNRSFQISFRGCLLTGLILVLSCSCGSNGVKTGTHDAYVVMVSFDGFRWDYSDLYNTPSFDAMEQRGVKAERMIPSFPTKTFPNHYTLATGLYPDHHGIINNTFYDEGLGGLYRMGSREMVTNAGAYFGEPVWVTAEQQGIRTACYYWVGSEAPVLGTYPAYRKRYDESVPYLERVDQVMDWLTLPLDQRPGLVMLYFDEPDHTGQLSGPENPATGKEIEYLDSVLGYLRGKIASLDYGDRVNLIVLSDHGMGDVSPQRYINLYDHLKEGWTVRVVGGNPVYLIDPVEDYQDSIVNALNRVDGMTAWEAAEIPHRLHYGTSTRFPGILVAADSLWSIGTQPGGAGYTGGAHGYDNAFTAMHTIFYAEGPAFKENFAAPAFPNVDVYNIICHILDLKPAENDGDFQRVSSIFRTGQ